MALGACLPDLLARKAISQATYDRLKPRYDELTAQFEPRFGRTAAESMATKRVLDGMELDLAHRKRKALLQNRVQGEWTMAMKQASGDGPLDRVPAEQFLVDMDGHHRAIEGQAQMMLFDLLANHRRDLLGRPQDLDGLDDVLAEIFDRPTGNAEAKAIADAWREVTEWLRSRYNAAGGRIGKLETWRLPQKHNAQLVLDAGFEPWRDFLLPLLDRKAMIDYDTNLPMSAGKLELLLRDMWDTITAGGANRRKPGQMGQGAMANRRQEHRVLHFLGPDEWKAYADNFGGVGSIFDAMLGHIGSMSRDIAAMERMGPNPNATLKFMQDSLDISAETARLPGKEGQRAKDSAKAGIENLQNLFDEFTGRYNEPIWTGMARGFSIFRSQQTAAKLGGAMLSVGGDYGLMMHNAKFNGIPAAKVMARYLKLMNPRATADRAQAARHVLMASQWADSHAALWAQTGEAFAHEGARQFASSVLRLSGLVAHTDIARMAFAQEAIAHMTHMRDHAYGNLEAPFRDMLARYGIDEAAWNTYRSVEPDSYQGTDWIFADKVAKVDQRLADNINRMLVTEADYAVPVPDLRTRAMINSKLRRGTLMGEGIRSGFLFKGFALTVLNMHGRRMLQQGPRGQLALASLFVWRYGLSLLALTTLGGALSLQVKELAKGNDPREMDDGKFWAAAVAQGGGLGIIGDLLFSSQNRFGGGVIETLAGPAGQFLNNTAGATIRNVAAMTDGDDETQSQWRKDAGKLVMSETPGLSLWYARLMIDRTLGDLVTEWTYGDDAFERNQRLIGYAEERGTAPWAPPGTGMDFTQWRAPDFGNALGREEEAASE